MKILRVQLPTPGLTGGYSGPVSTVFYQRRPGVETGPRGKGCLCLSSTPYMRSSSVVWCLLIQASSVCCWWQVWQQRAVFSSLHVTGSLGLGIYHFIMVANRWLWLLGTPPEIFLDYVSQLWAIDLKHPLQMKGSTSSVLRIGIPQSSAN